MPSEGDVAHEAPRSAVLSRNTGGSNQTAVDDQVTLVDGDVTYEFATIDGEDTAIERRLAYTTGVAFTLRIYGEAATPIDTLCANAGIVAENQMCVIMEFNGFADICITVHHIPAAMIMDIAVAAVACNLYGDGTSLLNAILIEIRHVGLTEKGGDGHVIVFQVDIVYIRAAIKRCGVIILKNKNRCVAGRHLTIVTQNKTGSGIKWCV